MEKVVYEPQPAFRDIHLTQRGKGSFTRWCSFFLLPCTLGINFALLPVVQLTCQLILWATSKFSSFSSITALDRCRPVYQFWLVDLVSGVVLVFLLAPSFLRWIYIIGCCCLVWARDTNISMQAYQATHRGSGLGSILLQHISHR